MALSTKLEDYLKTHRVRYEVIPHKKTTSAKETADAENIGRDYLAKVVLVKCNFQHVMTVIPARYNLDLLKLREVLGSEDIRVEKEEDFKNVFPDCELGAMPPFGKLYGMNTYVDVRLTDCADIFIESGDHEQGICLATADYLKIAKAEIADLVAA